MSTPKTGEFQEIAHSGGQITFSVVTDADGHRAFQVGWKHSRPTPSAIFAIYALPEGIPVGTIKLGGIGQPWNPPPAQNCVPVFIASDTQGKFGHQCRQCQGYWRSSGAAIMCPYCGVHGQRHEFLSDAQLNYVAQYCDTLQSVLRSAEDGEHAIDMDAVSDAAGKDVKKPAFYYAEESQQKNYNCAACGTFNDIIGKFGYCCVCGTRNDLQELQNGTPEKIRSRLSRGESAERCVADAVGAFDTFVRQYSRQIEQRIPMRPNRRNRLGRMTFHNLKNTAMELKAVVDIDILDTLTADDVQFAELMFRRRQIYEHNGSVADEKYLAESGDSTVRKGQVVHQSMESAHRIMSLIAKMGQALHQGFHEIFPPEAGPIDEYKRREALKHQNSPPTG